MGFRPGLCDYHGLPFIPFLSNQDLVLFALLHGAQSCWKMKPLPHSFFPSFSRVRKISQTYAAASSQLLTTHEASNPTGLYASPYLHSLSFVLMCGYNTVWVVPLSYTSNKRPPPWDQLKNWLVGKQHLRPLLRCPILPLLRTSYNYSVMINNNTWHNHVTLTFYSIRCSVLFTVMLETCVHVRL